MIVSSFSPSGRYPLYAALAAALALCALLAGLSLWGSIENQRQLDAGVSQLLQRCSTRGVDATCQAAAALHLTLERRTAVMLLLQGLAFVLILAGTALIAHRGYHVLVRRTRSALELCTPSARERGRDEIERLIESLAELTARQAGLQAEDRWQQQLDAAQLRRNAVALHTLHQAMRMFGQGDVSEAGLLQALRLLEAALGAQTVAVQLHGGAREALGAAAVVATRGEPKLMARLAQAAPATHDTGARVVPPSAEFPAQSLVVPLSRHGVPLGTLIAEFADTARIDEPQTQLAETVAQLAGLAISSLSRSQEERRVALMEERGAIAAELHDSLAQSLAFMKIQVARLQAGLAEEGTPSPQVSQAAAELREGLSAAYHEVRELIAAFRVRMGPGGLRVAVQDAIADFSQRSDLQISFDDQMGKCQLEVNEEFHVLQLVREAIANAVRHARAEHVWVCASYRAGHQFVVTVDDDGGGLDSGNSASSHYGLSIMRERARSLHGEMSLEPREGGGTRVRLAFAPQRFPIDAPDPETTA